GQQHRPAPARGGNGIQRRQKSRNHAHKKSSERRRQSDPRQVRVLLQKALAARELASPDKAMAQVTLADDWWNVGESLSGSARQTIQSHASIWCRKALPELNGLTKARVDRRITAARLASDAEGELLPLMIGKFTPGENGIVVLKEGDRIKTPEA